MCLGNLSMKIFELINPLPHFRVLALFNKGALIFRSTGLRFLTLLFYQYIKNKIYKMYCAGLRVFFQVTDKVKVVLGLIDFYECASYLTATIEFE